MWLKVLGAFLVALVAVEIVLFIRWLRKPVAPEAIEERNQRFNSAMPKREQKVPPRSKW